MDRYSTSLFIREMKIKTKRYNQIFTRMTKIENTDNIA